MGVLRRKLAFRGGAPRRSERPPPWRRHLRTTREGKVFIMVTLGVGLAGFNTGNNLLYLVFGFLLSLIVLSGILSELVLRRLRLERRLPARAFARQTCLVEIVVRNAKTRIPSYSVEVEDLAAGARSERRCYFLKIAAGTEQRAIYRRTPGRRGRLRFTGFRVATRYPFGIFEKWRVLSVPGELLVYPAIERTFREVERQAASGEEVADAHAGLGSEIGGLREYRRGDEARHIHWRRSAALGRVIVRERERDAAAELRIELDNLRPPNADAAWRDAFERAVSRAAGLVSASLAEGVKVEVVTRDGQRACAMPGAAPDALLEFLALVEPADPVVHEGVQVPAKTPGRGGFVSVGPIAGSVADREL